MLQVNFNIRLHKSIPLVLGCFKGVVELGIELAAGIVIKKTRTTHLSNSPHLDQWCGTCWHHC